MGSGKGTRSPSDLVCGLRRLELGRQSFPFSRSEGAQQLLLDASRARAAPRVAIHKGKNLGSERNSDLRLGAHTVEPTSIHTVGMQFLSLGTNP